MTQIHDLPEEKTFGYGFNYAVWSANSNVMLANVPWNSDYRDVVRFVNQGALDNYIQNISGPVINIPSMTYAAMGLPVRLDIPFEAVMGFNYLRAYNPAQPIMNGDLDEGQAYYYFITGVTYVAPNVTEIMLQLDVWQSFVYGATFGNCYVEQGHIGIANENDMLNYGRDYLTVPEGLDVGNEYLISKQYSLSLASARTPSLGISDYSVLVASVTALDEEPGTEKAPKMNTAKGSVMENLPNGAEIYLFNSMEHFKLFMEAMKDKPWIMNGIISIQAVPRMARYNVSLNSTIIAGVPVDEVQGGALTNVKTALANNWRNEIDLGRYSALNKFKVFPYTVVEVTTYAGTPLVLKPECWQDPDMNIVEMPHFAPPNPKLAIVPYRYNAGDGSPAYNDANGVVNDGGEFLDFMTGINNFPAFSIVNDGYMQFMAANVNGIAYQNQSADWAFTRANAGADNAYNQASGNIGTSQDINSQQMSAAQSQVNLQNQTGAFRAIQSGINSVGQIGNGPLGVVGAATGMVNAGIGYAIDVHQANEGLAISNQLAAGSNASTTNNMAFQRDTNMDLARFATQGDYSNAIAGINAKVQDAKLTQPSTAGQVGGDAFNLAAYRWGVDAKVKTLQPALMAAIGEIWLRYGYKVNRFITAMPSDFAVMSNFTYWKLKETYVTSANCPETYKRTLRGIFEKGVTVWKNPNDIGNIDTADNTPLEGIVL